MTASASASPKGAQRGEAERSREGPGAQRAEAERSQKAWLLAARPRTLAVGAAPVLVGTALAVDAGGVRWLPAAAALAGALLLQIGTNLANDVFDHERGADGADRVGPPRAVALGWIAPAQMKRAAALVFAAAACVGTYLVAVGGWPIALLGAVSIAAGIAYTGGPWPLAYHGLGDVFVFAFFGVAAVCGTFYVQTLGVSPLALAASVPIGMLATSVLAVNNLRDLASDARAGKRTLAVRLGPRGARRQVVALLLGAYAWLPVAWLAGAGLLAVLLPLATLPGAVALVRRTGSAAGPALNPLLGACARLELRFAVLMAAGLAL